MATAPPTSSRRKHVRNPTPVIPALPLPFADGKWSRPSQPALPEEPAAPLSRSAGDHHEPASIPSSSPSERESHTGATSVPSQETQLDVEPTSTVPDELASTSVGDQDGRNTLPQNTEDNIRAELKSQGNNTVNEEVSASIDPAHEPQAVLAPHADADSSHDAQAQSKRVRLVDEETQASEPELSSVQPSSTTGLTDYGSSVGESTLETVVDGPPQAKRASAMPHRKSEIAPEVFANGLLPRPTHSQQPSIATNGSVSSQVPVVAEPVPMPDLQNYLQYLASNKQFADVVLQVNQADRSYQPSLHYAHWLLLMRSDKLSKLTPDFDQTIQSKVLNFYPSRNILPHAFEAAVRFFYSDNLLTSQSLLQSGGFDPQFRAQALEYIFSYWMAGVELGLSLVKQRSYDLLKEILDFDLVELVAKEIKELRAVINGLPGGRDQTEIREITNTISRLVAQLFSERINLQDLQFDTDTQTGMLPSRFSHLAFNRSNNPALTGVVFGNLPTKSISPSPASIASSIMLNMDFDDVAIMATELLAQHGQLGAATVEELVRRREDQRLQVVSNRAVSNKQRLSNPAAWAPAGIKESINERGQVVHEKVGFVLPTKNR